MNYRNDVGQLGLEHAVKCFLGAETDQAIFVGQLGEDTDFVIILELHTQSHYCEKIKRHPPKKSQFNPGKIKQNRK
jgi:hypothetical protein